ncbi:DNA cytosine methyltransferase [Iamia majanohamensis]|uniref:DNA (cytosine-5-)-methyltransferase n=1 Tax=Iamia majanohamensis TaxID=467976 RepID=A0AAE9Y536_9ACTN|nr:DNA cytosine methyltransferase [Iamia majanohamensis]WCO66815.1 DNA cytosine methyltransferase [Iamia majanohamensis]
MAARPDTALDLFAGPGGMTQGFRTAGYKVVGAVEIDDLAVETYEANHPGVPVFHNDIRSLSPTQSRRRLGLERYELGLLGGCPPCQGFSSTRTLNGSRRVRDPRNALMDVYCDWVEEFMPHALLLENVPAMQSDWRFAVFRRRLRSLGYETRHSTATLNASDYGVPQRRRRLVVVAARNRILSLASAPRVPPRTVRDAIGKLPSAGSSGDPLHDMPERRSETVRQLIALIPKDGGSRSALPADKVLGCHRRSDGFSDVYGRMAWDRPAPTITGGCFNPSKGRFLHPLENRAITLREAALLQGFAPDYTFSLRRGKEAAAGMIGNALPPPFVAAQASHILASMACH